MIDLAQGSIIASRGRWKPAVLDGRPSALVSCPRCGGFGSLVYYEIVADGTVRPSFVCPYAIKDGCSFNDEIRLVGWVDRPMGLAEP